MLLSTTSTTALPVASDTGVNSSGTVHPLPFAQFTARLPPRRGAFSASPSPSSGHSSSVTDMLSPGARLSARAPAAIFSHGTSATAAVTAPLSPLPSLATVTSTYRSCPTAIVVATLPGVARRCACCVCEWKYSGISSAAPSADTTRTKNFAYSHPSVSPVAVAVIFSATLPFPASVSGSSHERPHSAGTPSNSAASPVSAVPLALRSVRVRAASSPRAMSHVTGSDPIRRIPSTSNSSCTAALLIPG